MHRRCKDGMFQCEISNLIAFHILVQGLNLSIRPDPIKKKLQITNSSIKETLSHKKRSLKKKRKERNNMNNL